MSKIFNKEIKSYFSIALYPDFDSYKIIGLFMLFFVLNYSCYLINLNYFSSDKIVRKSDSLFYLSLVYVVYGFIIDFISSGKLICFIFYSNVFYEAFKRIFLNL